MLKPNEPTAGENDNSRLISEAIFNDKMLKLLHAKRVEIYSIATPTLVADKEGKDKTIWIDETNHPLLPKIDKLIEERQEQIKNHFNHA